MELPAGKQTFTMSCLGGRLRHVTLCPIRIRRPRPHPNSTGASAKTVSRPAQLSSRDRLPASISAVDTSTTRNRTQQVHLPTTTSALAPQFRPLLRQQDRHRAQAGPKEMRLASCSHSWEPEEGLHQDGHQGAKLLRTVRIGAEEGTRLESYRFYQCRDSRDHVIPFKMWKYTQFDSISA